MGASLELQGEDMAVHHLSCGTMCPITIGTMCCHCLLVETDDGLVLVETGLGTADVREASKRFSRMWRFMARPTLDPNDCAVRQIEQLGFAPSDVRHIVVTHLDLDHAGGIPDFPHATVHVHARELEAAKIRKDSIARERYIPAHFAHGPRWKTYAEAGERWFGFEGIRALGDAQTDVLLIPLPGHTEGHTGVAVRDGDRWLLHCGDAYFHRNTVQGGRVPFGLALFERRMEVDGELRRHNATRLAQLVREHPDEVVVFNSHDATQLEAARSRLSA